MDGFDLGPAQASTPRPPSRPDELAGEVSAGLFGATTGDSIQFEGTFDLLDVDFSMDGWDGHIFEESKGAGERAGDDGIPLPGIVDDAYTALSPPHLLDDDLWKSLQPKKLGVPGNDDQHVAAPPLHERTPERLASPSLHSRHCAFPRGQRPQPLLDPAASSFLPTPPPGPTPRKKSPIPASAPCPAGDVMARAKGIVSLLLSREYQLHGLEPHTPRRGGHRQDSLLDAVADSQQQREDVKGTYSSLTNMIRRW